MAQKSNNTAVAIVRQLVADTFQAVTQPDDLMPVSNLRLTIDGVTIANDEYTGSEAKNADVVAGKRVTLAYNVKLRPPGGADVPAAHAFLLGRVLQAAKMTELRTTAAIPVAPEALGAGSTTTKAVLGASAAATAGLYKGLPLLLSDNGATFNKQITAIRSYDAAKGAVLPETLGAPPAANYQIPKSLAYVRSVAAGSPTLDSHSVWLGGDRYDLMNCRLTGLRIVVPTSTRDQAAYPEIEATWDATISARAAQVSPAIPPLGAVPLFRDGDLHVANKRIGGSTFTIDLGIQTENPPNPNMPDGNDAPEIVGSTARLSQTRQKYAMDVFDSIAMADAQDQISFYAAWGNGSGKTVQIIVPDARPNYASPDLGSGIANESGDMFIDAFDRGVVIAFPYQ